MSDEVAAPVEAEAAPAEPNEQAAAAPAQKAPPKPRTIDDDLEDVFKKHGGYEYSKGKKLERAQDLKRMLGRGSAEQAATQEALKRAQKADSIEQSIAQLEHLPKPERLKALKALGIKPESIRDAMEDDILEADAKAKERSALSQREREMQERIDKQETELQQVAEAKRQWEEEQKHAAHVAEIEAIGQRMDAAALKAVQKLKIDPKHVSRFLPAIAERLDRAERLKQLNPGYEYDENDVAEMVATEHGELADQFYGGLELEALAERLERIQIEDPENPGKKMSRLSQLMKHQAAKIRARLNGSAPVANFQQPRQTNGKEETQQERWERLRTFGGVT